MNNSDEIINNFKIKIFRIIISILSSFIIFISLDYLEPIGWDLFYEIIINTNSQLVIIMIVGIVSFISSIISTAILYKILDKIIMERVFVYTCGVFIVFLAIFSIIYDYRVFPDEFYNLIPVKKYGLDYDPKYYPELWSGIASWIGIKYTVSILSSLKNNGSEKNSIES